MNNQLRALGAAVARRRNYLELSQDELARMIGTDSAFVRNLEDGRHNPNFDMLVKIAQAMDTSTSALVSDMPFDSEEAV